MLRRCDAIVRAADAKGVSEDVKRWVHDRVQPHKHDLRKRLLGSLDKACRCFESAMCGAETSCQQIKGSGARLAQMTELALLQAEVWEESLVTATASNRDEVVARFVEVQTAWEGVYITGRDGTPEEKKMRGVAIGITRDTRSVSDTYSPMMQACGRGLEILVRAVLNARGAAEGQVKRWVDHADPDGRRPLHLACYNGHKEVVVVLVDKFRDTLDVNQATKEGATPLFFACGKGHEEIVSLLLTINEIDVNLGLTILGQVITPLSACEGLGHAHIAQQLRDHKVTLGSHD